MSTINKNQFKNFIEQYDFTGLFNQLGWNYLDEETPVKLKDETFIFQAVAEKSGFRIFVFNPSKHQNLPDYSIRLQLDRTLSKLYREHLIIFCDAEKTVQIWQLFIKQLGKPSRLSETRWYKGQEPELLYQKTSNLFFTLDQEENITIADVVDVVNENFSKNVDQVTKKFYENFRKEHKKFIEFIDGISIITDREWYASLMLNRLMFCYFIQKKGFLDKNLNYLKDKLKYCQQRKGKDQFYVSFYKNFLLALFHQGLGSPEQSEELKNEIGKIPYLNGGLFDVHELEKQYENIDISDSAFENIFNFFDQYNWHLDTNVNATGKDINPDVIGYIFEKYINDRAQMGAYYTKEDITDYISKNCIIPFLFDETERKLKKAIGTKESEDIFSEIWQILFESDDTYIYDAVKKGVNLNLPEEIEIGVDPNSPNLIERRKEWNKPALPEFALPTEIWREVIERRNRYYEIKNKIKNGEINSINDFITYNLNIRQFTQDVIDNHSNSDFIKHFYETLNSITIIDPTCGSGAFLFAAMNILEPLYQSSLMRMHAFVEDEDFLNKEQKPKFNNKYKSFRDILANTQNEHHPNLPYFIFKSIILNNLYGVDIMKEAVEIAKLRLFLKLVATVEVEYQKPNFGLEPLPDIDFNIRAGNTLVGFASEKELEKSLIEDLLGSIVKNEIEEKCEIVAKAFTRYKKIQLDNGNDYLDFKNAKDDLNTRIKELNHELNLLLHKQADKINFESWKDSHKPFHWFSEFYEIIHDQGGFDVVIGNPPYVVYSSSNFDYKLTNYQTLSCANLYAFCSERSLKILKIEGKFGMIIPNSSISADKFSPLQKIFTKNKVSWISNYSWRPSKLFDGADMLLAIIISTRNSKQVIFSSKYQKWYNEFRTSLFENIKYNDATNSLSDGSIPKIPAFIYNLINDKLKLKSNSKILLNNFHNSVTNYKFYYFRAVQYWVKILDTEPKYLDNGFQTTTGEMKPIYTESDELKYILISLLSSSLFFIHYITWASCQVINSRDFEFPFDYQSLNNKLANKLYNLGKNLQRDYCENSHTIERSYSKKGRDFKMIKQHYYIKKSKTIIDEIDTVLAEYYGFTDEELDFIINYDIKYRMGKELDNGEEE